MCFHRISGVTMVTFNSNPVVIGYIGYFKCIIGSIASVAIIVLQVKPDFVVIIGGGWWYNSCHNVNINGLYNNTEYGLGIIWARWLGFKYSLKSVSMKIRPKLVISKLTTIYTITWLSALSYHDHIFLSNITLY
jgi:hypothetical protein